MDTDQDDGGAQITGRHIGFEAGRVFIEGLLRGKDSHAASELLEGVLASVADTLARQWSDAKSPRYIAGYSDGFSEATTPAGDADSHSG